MSLPSEEVYRHLGSYSGLVQLARGVGPLFPPSGLGNVTRQKAQDVLRFADGETNQVKDVLFEGKWSAEGIAGECLSWSVGFGPRTCAWLLKPSDADGPLPAILALHDHSH